MKILILHHDPLESEFLPRTGGSLRTQHLLAGISFHQSEATLIRLCKAECEGNWQKHIHNGIASSQPDVILCTQMEDVCLLPSREMQPNLPVIVDLYAPRLLETMYTEEDGQTAQQLLLALDRADLYLYAHPRQYDHWNGLLRLVGVDLREERLLLCPLAVDAILDPPAKETVLTFIGGGRVWPWQNPWQNLNRLLSILDEVGQGEVVWFTSPDQSEIPITHSRLHTYPWNGRHQYREQIAKAHIGLDLNPPSHERSLAYGFRHVEMLGCHTPIVSTNQNALCMSHPTLSAFIDMENESTEEIWTTLQQLSETPPTTELTDYTEAYSPRRVVEPLLSFLHRPTCRTVSSNRIIRALHPLQASDEALTKLRELEAQVQHLQRDNSRQQSLLAEANQQVQSTTSSLLQVSKSLEQISAFKNDIAHNWSDLMHQQQDRIQTLETELRQLYADNAKKSAELAAMDQLRARLENDLQHVRQELDVQKKSRWRR